MEYIYALANGVVIGISSYGRNDVDKRFRVVLYVDINGAKGPNQMGKDFFFLCLSSRKNYPIVTGYNLVWVGRSYCSISATPSGWYSGGGCSIWVIATGNMDYLHREITQEEWASIPIGTKVPQ